MRQLTVDEADLEECCFSKLPMRQLTVHIDDLDKAVFSKLPMRQLTSDDINICQVRNF